MITVVIASYNYGCYAAHAIESVLSQTHPPDRILVVDDGAHDGIDKIANFFGVESIVRPENLGTVANFNDILCNHVKTDKVMFLGADNWLRPDALEKLNLDADIVSYDMCVTGENASNLPRVKKHCQMENGYYVQKFRVDPPALINRRNTIHGSALYNANMAKQFGYRGLERRTNRRHTQEDWQLWKDMLLKGNAKRIHVPEPLLFYRRHRGNFSGSY